MSPRRRWLYTQGGRPLPEPIEVGAEFRNSFGESHKSEAEVYGDARATDGTPIDSKKRLREYLKHTGLAHSSDFSEGYRERVVADRERASDRHLAETVDRAFHKHRGKP